MRGRICSHIDSQLCAKVFTTNLQLTICALQNCTPQLLSWLHANQPVWLLPVAWLVDYLVGWLLGSWVVGFSLRLSWLLLPTNHYLSVLGELCTTGCTSRCLFVWLFDCVCIYEFVDKPKCNQPSRQPLSRSENLKLSLTICYINATLEITYKWYCWCWRPKDIGALCAYNRW